MIALCIGLAALSTALTGFVILQGVWLHSAGRDAVSYADHLAGQRQLVAEYKHKYETEFAAHGVTQAELANEKQLCAVAQAQRNEAMRKADALLRAHAKDATDDEIRDMVRELFSTPLAVVQPAPRRSDSGPDALLDPNSPEV